MTTTRKKLLIGAVVIVLALGFVAYQGARSSIVYYLTPTEYAARPDLRGAKVRLAGTVRPGSVQRAEGEARFVIADAQAAFPVRFAGPLPDLFAEGRDVLVEGRLGRDDVFVAAQVITTHPVEYKEKRPGR